MKTKPDHISQHDWDSVDVPDMGNAPSDHALRSSATTAQGIAADVQRRLRGRQRAPVKKPITIRLPVDVIEFFKRGEKDGKGWQTRLRSTLEEHVKTHGH